MRKRLLVLIMLINFPIFLQAQEFFSASISPSMISGPDYLNDYGISFSVNSDLYIGYEIDLEYPLFFGLDFLTSGGTFSDQKTNNNINGQFFVFDAVAGGYINIDYFAYLLFGMGAGYYFCPCRGSTINSTFDGFALNLSSEISLRVFEYCNLGFSYKLYGLFGAGWFNTFGINISLFLEDFWLYFY